MSSVSSSSLSTKIDDASGDEKKKDTSPSLATRKLVGLDCDEMMDIVKAYNSEHSGGSIKASSSTAGDDDGGASEKVDEGAPTRLDPIPDLLESEPLSASNLAFLETLKSKMTADEISDVGEVDWLLFVRGYAKEEDRLERTLEVLRKTLRWRRSVGYAKFARSRLPDDEMFYQFYPERIMGTDRYGHIVTSTTIGDLNTDVLVNDFEIDHLKRLQAQKLCLLTELKTLTSRRLGFRTYKHSAVIDLKGMTLSMVAGDGKRALQGIMGIGNSYFPESLWKMYLVNAPFVFKAVWNVVSPFIHPITKAKIRIERDPAVARQKMLDDGVPLTSIPEYLGGKARGVDCVDMLLRGMVVEEDASKLARQKWPKRERRELAPAVVKRRGFHGSVYSQDATPFNGMEGWLDKRGDDGYFLSGSFARKWFRVNNEYLNYYDADDSDVVIGSYNIKKMTTADVSDKREGDGTCIEIRFKDGAVKILRAADDALAKKWVMELLDRKTWFDDIWDATESALKKSDMENAAKERAERERVKEKRRKDLGGGGGAGSARGWRSGALSVAGGCGGAILAVLAAVAIALWMGGWWWWR